MCMMLMNAMIHKKLKFSYDDSTKHPEVVCEYTEHMDRTYFMNPSKYAFLTLV